jgi:hypothetical protein
LTPNIFYIEFFCDKCDNIDKENAMSTGQIRENVNSQSGKKCLKIKEAPYRIRGEGFFLFN